MSQQQPFQPTTPALDDPVDVSNVQGDIVVGFPKKSEVFWFFTIDPTKVGQFRVNLKKILPFITTGQTTQDKRKEIYDHKKNNEKGLVELTLTNISFSRKGLNKICPDAGVDPDIKDDVFSKGMFADAAALGDNVHDWNRGFVENNIDGVILIAGDNAFRNASLLGIIMHLLEADKPSGPVKEAFRLTGNTRPGAEDGHEHFGFEDGVSLPAVPGLGKQPTPYQLVYDAGRLLHGHKNDNEFPTNQPKTRPAWTEDGSILAFRKLDQLVPEFNKYVNDNAHRIDNPQAGTKASDLLGACMVGRWKSGSPLQKNEFKDGGIIDNDFDFKNDASKCPLSAHIRKTNPRHDDTPDNDTTRHGIMRRGIQYGDEVTEHEKSSQHSDPAHPRGLLFVCYQSNLSNGFHFMQTLWANNPQFHVQGVGFDPLIGRLTSGVAAQGTVFDASGFDRKDPAERFVLTPFIVPRGGEYFFSPSISALTTIFAKSA